MHGKVDITTERGDALELHQEALLFDLYYRENCKSRPKWAADATSFKEMTRTYCKRGMLSHVEPFHYLFPDKKVRTLKELPARQKEPVFVLFDYEKRDPLDHQAAVSLV